ncbi:hypothetical protein [Halobellus captivus]|uniref:hypothetical protein n=1 Tax=Halobellus captivus TaxID=2592614 RepID=UPI001396B195|nr:hypothetical protein [Halobellus captivus]
MTKHDDFLMGFAVGTAVLNIIATMFGPIGRLALMLAVLIGLIIGLMWGAFDD